MDSKSYQSQGLAQASASADMERPNIFGNLNKLEENLALLHDTISHMENKLGPITCPPAPILNGEKLGAPTPNCEVDARTQPLADGVMSANLRLRYLSDRICL